MALEVIGRWDNKSCQRRAYFFPLQACRCLPLFTLMFLFLCSCILGFGFISCFRTGNGPVQYKFCFYAILHAARLYQDGSRKLRERNQVRGSFVARLYLSPLILHKIFCFRCGLMVGQGQRSTATRRTSGLGLFRFSCYGSNPALGGSRHAWFILSSSGMQS